MRGDLFLEKPSIIISSTSRSPWAYAYQTNTVARAQLVDWSATVPQSSLSPVCPSSPCI